MGEASPCQVGSSPVPRKLTSTLCIFCTLWFYLFSPLTSTFSSSHSFTYLHLLTTLSTSSSLSLSSLTSTFTYLHLLTTLSTSSSLSLSSLTSTFTYLYLHLPPPSLTSIFTYLHSHPLHLTPLSSFPS